MTGESGYAAWAGYGCRWPAHEAQTDVCACFAVFECRRYNGRRGKQLWGQAIAAARMFQPWAQQADRNGH